MLIEHGKKRAPRNFSNYEVRNPHLDGEMHGRLLLSEVFP